MGCKLSYDTKPVDYCLGAYCILPMTYVFSHNMFLGVSDTTCFYFLTVLFGILFNGPVGINFFCYLERFIEFQSLFV